MSDLGKKYELTDETKTRGEEIVVRRIRALRDFENGNMVIKKGDLGGFVESEANLSHEGNCWIADEAMVYNHARVYDKALAHGSAMVHGCEILAGNAIACGYNGLSITLPSTLGTKLFRQHWVRANER